MKTWTFLFVSVLLFLPKPSLAFMFQPQIDHCAITDGGYWYGQQGSNCGTSFTQGSNVAYSFNIDSALHANSIEGWMSFNDAGFPVDKAGANLVIYEDSLETFAPVPSSNRIFEKNFAFNVPTSTDTAADWRGVYDMNLHMKPGRYWVGFEDGVKGTYIIGTQGLQFSAIHNPEPMSLILLGGGLIGGLLLRRRRKNYIRIEL